VFRINDGFLPASSEISNAQVVIRYLNANGTEITNKPSDPNANVVACLNNSPNCIRYVEVCLSKGTTCNSDQLIAFKPMIGLFSGTDLPSPDLRGISIPLSTVRMPAESLGFDPTS
jgi:hypothetical protein